MQLSYDVHRFQDYTPISVMLKNEETCSLESVKY